MFDIINLWKKPSDRRRKKNCEKTIAGGPPCTTHGRSILGDGHQKSPFFFGCTNDGMDDPKTDIIRIYIYILDMLYL